MNKARRILQGWKNVFREDEVIEAIAKERAAHCAGCYEALAGLVCGCCYCPLVAKVRSPGERCDLGKWEAATAAQVKPGEGLG